MTFQSMEVLSQSSAFAVSHETKSEYKKMVSSVYHCCCKSGMGDPLRVPHVMVNIFMLHVTTLLRLLQCAISCYSLAQFFYYLQPIQCFFFFFPSCSSLLLLLVSLAAVFCDRNHKNSSCKLLQFSLALDTIESMFVALRQNYTCSGKTVKDWVDRSEAIRNSSLCSPDSHRRGRTQHL